MKGDEAFCTLSLNGLLFLNFRRAILLLKVIVVQPIKQE